MPSLDELNRLTPDEAKRFFLACCGSTRWARSMSDCRPFWHVRIVYNAADALWQQLSNDDRREALRRRTAAWNADPPDAMRDDLEFFLARFGYPFVMAPPLPPPAEIHAALRRRLECTPDDAFDLSVAEELRMLRAELRARLEG